MSTHYKTMRLILGDQLNAGHSWYKEKNHEILYVIAEIHQELNYVVHHCQKICAFFAAMNAFSQSLEKAGHDVLYLTLDETSGYQSLPDLICVLCKRYNVKGFEFQRPDEYRLREQLGKVYLPEYIKVSEVDTEHFLLPFDEIKHYFKKDKHHKMEFFYRKMRQRFSILMDADKPIGGKWNYDTDNRNKLKKDDLPSIPEPLLFGHSTKNILERLKRHNIHYFGKEVELLFWPVTRKDAIALLDYFCAFCLPKFGTFQDAMTCQSESQWSLYHSRLSFSLNAKILQPLHVVQRAVAYYENHRDSISIAQIEGFVRQIIGWREYIRGVYWSNMPSYAQKNQLNTDKELPDYFWTANTKMQCMKSTIQQSLDYSYAHHIQRLMVTGNFCLLTGIGVSQVDMWYLGVYIDAIEWVEMPNTRGMSQFADGGIVATKPYAASGNYINKMSDYCQKCHYNVKEKTSEQACPFNSLYWHFMIKHRDKVERNPRIGMVYRNWDKQNKAHQKATLDRAAWCLNNIDTL